MKATNKNSHLSEQKKEQLIQDALRTGGFVLPQTVNEIIEFEKRFGTTPAELPEDLKQPFYLFIDIESVDQKTKVDSVQTNYASAARSGNNGVTNEVQKKMEQDRLKADRSRKQKVSKR